eukprot:TCONS_00044045-protein
MSKRKLYLMILATWLSPVTLFLPIMIDRLVFMISLTALFTSPLIIIIAAYYKVVRYVKKNTFIFDNIKQNQIRRERNKKIVKRLIILIICYFVCILPLTVNFFLEFFIKYNREAIYS